MGAGWRWAKEGKMGIFIIVSTIKIRKKIKCLKKQIVTSQRYIDQMAKVHYWLNV